MMSITGYTVKCEIYQPMHCCQRKQTSVSFRHVPQITIGLHEPHTCRDREIYIGFISLKCKGQFVTFHCRYLHKRINNVKYAHRYSQIIKSNIYIDNIYWWKQQRLFRMETGAAVAIPIHKS